MCFEDLQAHPFLKDETEQNRTQSLKKSSSTTDYSGQRHWGRFMGGTDLTVVDSHNIGSCGWVSHLRFSLEREEKFWSTIYVMIKSMPNIGQIICTCPVVSEVITKWETSTQSNWDRNPKLDEMNHCLPTYLVVHGHKLDWKRQTSLSYPQRSV